MVGHGVEAGATLSVLILLEMVESHGKQQRSKRAEISNLGELGHGYFGSAKFQLLSRKMEL